jgi:hypothetical protein
MDTKNLIHRIGQHPLLTVSLIAVFLRVAVAFAMGDTVIELPGVFDQVSYHNLALRVASGFGFSFGELWWPVTPADAPTAHWSFLYTLYLVAIYSVFGPHPIIARILQALIVGILHPYITYRIGEKLFSRTIGLAAAAVTAVYIYFFYYGAALMTEPFYITAILISLFLGMQLAENTDKKRDLQLGLALGVSLAITLLLRQVFLLFLPFLFLWIWVARFRQSSSTIVSAALRQAPQMSTGTSQDGSLAQRPSTPARPWTQTKVLLRWPGRASSGRQLPVVSTVLSFALIALFILPVTLYNYARFGRFVLLNTNSGYAFFWGNHPVYGTKFISILSTPEYQAMIPEELRHLDEAALDQELLKRGIQFVLDDPGRYILLSLSRIPSYFMFWYSPASGMLSNLSRLGSFGVFLPFMIYGLVLAVKNLPGSGNRLLNLLFSPRGLLMLFVLVYAGVHILTWTLIRYRLPVDAALIPFAGLALVDVVGRVTKYRSKVVIS